MSALALPAIRSLDEAPHPILPQIARESYRENQIQQRIFTQPGSFATKGSGPSFLRCRLWPKTCRERLLSAPFWLRNLALEGMPVPSRVRFEVRTHKKARPPIHRKSPARG